MQLLDGNEEPTGFLHINLEIFLFLDPSSLKSARQVARTWDKFIKSQMWGKPRIRKILEKRLLRQWRTSNPRRRELVISSYSSQEEITVLNMTCNETHLAVFCQFRIRNSKNYILFLLVLSY